MTSSLIIWVVGVCGWAGLLDAWAWRKVMGTKSSVDPFATYEILNSFFSVVKGVFILQLLFSLVLLASFWSDLIDLVKELWDWLSSRSESEKPEKKEEKEDEEDEGDKDPGKQ